MWDELGDLMCGCEGLQRSLHTSFVSNTPTQTTAAHTKYMGTGTTGIHGTSTPLFHDVPVLIAHLTAQHHLLNLLYHPLS